MDLADSFKVVGKLKIKKYDAEGSLVGEWDHKNLVVTAGKQLIASRLYSDYTPAITVTSASGNGTSAILTFATQNDVPYEVGSYITVVGMTPSAYNVTSARVTACTTTSVTYSSTASGSMTSAGTISSRNNGTITQMAIGQGSIAPNNSDISLYNQKAIVNLYSKQLSLADGDSSVIYVGQFPAGVGTSDSGSAIQEAALFSSNNIMLCRTLFSPITKNSGESLEIYWTVTIA
jgi:hypothetical protein